MGNVQQDRTKRKLSLLLFVFFLLLNIITSGAHTDSYDGIAYFLYTENLVLYKSLKFHTDLPSNEKLAFDVRQFAGVSLDRTGITLQEGQPTPDFYPPAAILLPVIGVVLYAVSVELSLPPIEFVSILLNPLIISGTSLVVYLFSTKIYSSRKIGLSAAMIFSFGSFIWSYNSSLFNQPLVGFVLVCSLYFLYKGIKNEGRFSVELSGFFLGLVVLAAPGHLFLVPVVLIYALYCFRKKKIMIFKFLIILLLVLAVQGIVNYERFGDITSFGYGKQESLSYHSGLIGLIGLLFSPGKGILFYFPIFIMFPISIYYFYKRKMSIGVLFWILFLASYLFFGTMPDISTWGGNAWGPRYFIPIIPLVSIAVGSLLLEKTKITTVLFSALVAIGFVVNLLGKLIWYMYGLAYGWEREELWKIDNTNIMTWSIDHSPIALHYKALMSDYIQTLDITKTIGGYHHLGLAPCQYDFYLYCTFGIIPILILASIISVMFYVLCKNMRQEIKL